MPMYPTMNIHVSVCNMHAMQRLQLLSYLEVGCQAVQLLLY